MPRKLLLAPPLLALLALLAWALRAPGASPRSEGGGARPSSRPPTEGRPALRAPPGEAAEPEDPDAIPLADSPLDGFGVVCEVRSDRGDAVPDVPVRLRLEGAGSARFSPREARTDASGTVRFGPLPVPAVPRRFAGSAGLVLDLVEPRGVGSPFRIGPEDLRRTPNPWAATSADPASTASVRWFRASLVRASGLPVSGRVLTEGGAPLEGALVSVGESDADPVRTDEDGRFRAFASGPGAVVVRAAWTTWDSTSLAREERVVVREPGGVEGLSIVVPGLGEIRGRALDPDGRPAVGARLVLTLPDETFDDLWLYVGGYGPPRHLVRKVAPDGTFRFVGTVTGERYDVRWWDGDTETVGAAGVLSGSHDVGIRLELHGVLARPVDARDGEPVRAEVSAGRGTEVLDPLRLWGWAPWGWDGGTFLGAPGSRVVLYARAHGYDDASVGRTVGAKPGVEVVPIPMRPKGSRATVRVRCVGTDGKALPWPDARWSHEPTGARFAPDGLVDAEGAFLTTDLVAGAYLLACDDGVPGGGPLRFACASETVVDVPSEGRADLAWTLPVGGALRITTRDADGSVVGAGDGPLRVRDRRGVETALRPFREDGPGRWREGTRGDGPYETQALPAERHLLLWYDPSGAGTPRASAWVDLRENEVTSVDLREGSQESGPLPYQFR